MKETSAFQTFCQDYEFWVETDSKQPPENCILCEKQSIDGRQLDNLYLNLQKAA